MNEFVGTTENGLPVADWPAVQREAAGHHRFVVTVEKYDEQRQISRQQMKYFHAVVVPVFADYIGLSYLMAELVLKKRCGSQWLVKKLDGGLCILSKTSLTVKQMNEWLKNIWDWSEQLNLRIPPPDPEWRKTCSTTK